MPGPLVVLAVISLLVAAGCGSAAGTASPEARASSDSTVGPSVAASDTASEPATPAPGSDDPAGSADATDDGAGEAPTAPPEATTSPEAAPAGDCTGTDENRTFYGSVASAVGWTVYCPVLPSGWYVETGQYRLAGGGRLAIAYRGPQGARFTLQEGAWCLGSTDCAPGGTAIGPTAFGDREGTLIATDDGGYAIAATGDGPIIWTLVGDGLDETTVRTFGAALIVAGD